MIDRYSNDNILGFHRHCNFKESWSGGGRGESVGKRKKKQGEEKKKIKAKEEKLCQDPSLFLREISLPYGFAVNGNTETICCSATFNPQRILKKQCSVLFYDSVHIVRCFHCTSSAVAFPAQQIPPVAFELATFSLLCAPFSWLSGHASFSATPLQSAAAPKPSVMWSETLAY